MNHHKILKMHVFIKYTFYQFYIYITIIKCI